MKKNTFGLINFFYFAGVSSILLMGTPGLLANDLKIASFNVSDTAQYVPEASENIFQGLGPDVAMLQEWVVEFDLYRDYVDRAFGADFYYYLGYSPGGGGFAYQPNGIVSRWAFQTMGGWPDTVGINKPDFAWAIIDIPGDVDLGVVSIHLKAGDTEEDKEQRVEEAQLIKDYMANSLAFNPSSNYIVVGGDLNAESQYEWCIETFATFLEPTNNRPKDRLGDKNTNYPSTACPNLQNSEFTRSKPYDWIMPNLLLDNLNTAVELGVDTVYSYPQGIVFDSHVFSRWAECTSVNPYTVLPNLPPVRYKDSHDSNMNHMAIMKSFDVFPSSTPSPTVTTTPVPSASPTPTLTPTPIFNPTTTPPPSATPILSPSATPKPTATRPPTPAPTPTAVIIMGPVYGRVYDRMTGEGVPNVYVRALDGGIASAGISDDDGKYTTGTLNADTYIVFADTFIQRDYKEQYYNQRDTASGATKVPSNSSGIDFPLYKKGYFPTPTVTPSPNYLNGSIDSGDYDGDGTSDIAVFRPSSGLWAIKGVTRVYFGFGSDQPVCGDYDGDGTSDIAIFRGSSGLWAIRSISRAYFGSGSDFPLPGDYNGDGACDIGIFRSATGLWAIQDQTRTYFGSAGDWPVPYNGAQLEKYIAIYRPTSGLWAVKNSTRVYYGTLKDQPVPANYRGLYADTAQLGIYRKTTGLWAVRGTTRIYYGGADDQPVPGNYRGNYGAEFTIFRGTSGLWASRGLTRLYFGRSGDIPVAGLAINPSSGGTP